MSETATYDGEYRAWSPGPAFAWVKAGSFFELGIFAGLLVVWAIPGMDRATFYFGLAHGIGYLALCVLIFVAILKREAPWWLLAATLTPVGPVGSVIGIEWIQRRRAKKARATATGGESS